MNRWTDELLESMRHVGDPVADGVIMDVFKSGDLPAVNNILHSLIENDDLVADNFPQTIRDYLRQTEILPDWADMKKIRQGSDLFAQYGPEIVMTLFAASLPVLYAVKRGAPVLTLTGRMETNLHRRVVETAQFIIDIMEPNGFLPDGHGLRSMQKVRLMHAAVRHFIQYDPRWQKQWD